MQKRNVREDIAKESDRVKVRMAVLSAVTLASMKVLKEDFGFTGEQIQKYSQKLIEAIKSGA